MNANPRIPVSLSGSLLLPLVLAAVLLGAADAATPKDRKKGGGRPDLVKQSGTDVYVLDAREAVLQANEWCRSAKVN